MHEQTGGRSTIDDRLSTKWRSRIICLAIFLASFAIYLKSLPPTFYLDDSPETVTAAVTLGIAHPPGYPLYTLLSRFWLLLAPGTVALCLNFLSALLVAAAAAVLFIALRRLASEIPAQAADLVACLPVLFFIQGNHIWAQAGSAKGGYYGLNLLFVSLLLLALVGGGRRRRASSLLLGLLLGLFVAHHWMSAFVFGLFLLASYGVNWKKWPPKPFWQIWYWFAPESYKLVIYRATAFLLGCSLYLYHPLRAVRKPLLNWEDPSTWENFRWAFLRRGYMGGEVAASAAVVGRQLWHSLGNFGREFGWPLFPFLLVALLAGIWELRGRRRLLAFLLACSLGLPLVLSFYLNLPLDRYYLIDGYMLTAYVTFMALVCAGFCYCWRRWPGRARAWGPPLALAAVVILLVRLGGEFPRHDRRGCSLAYDYGLNVLDSLPPNAVLFARGDAAVFPLWYFQYVEERRMDVAVIGVDGLPMEWVRRNLARLYPWLSVPGLRKKGRWGNEMLPRLMAGLVQLTEGSYPLYTNYNKLGEYFPRGYRLVPGGVVHRLERVGSGAYPAADLAERWRGYFLRGIIDGRALRAARPEARTMRDYSIMLNSTGVFYEDRGDEMVPRQEGQRELYAASLYWFRQALSLSPADKEFTYNVGNGYYHMGELVRAIRYYRRSLAIDPDYISARLNLAVAYYNLGDYSAARREAALVLEQEPENEKARFILKALGGGRRKSEPRL